MTSIADGAVRIQTSPESVASTPSWFGEVVLMAAHLRKQDVLSKISEGVRLRGGGSDTTRSSIFSRSSSGMPLVGNTPWKLSTSGSSPLRFPSWPSGRERLPARSTLSRFLAALTEEPVEALRTLCLDDLLSRPFPHNANDSNETQNGGMVDRTGNIWMVFDLDGTREAARQRVLPQTEDLPSAYRRLDDVCAPGYWGRKRGQVVRTRTVISEAHTFQWLGSFGNRGNGSYRMELRQGLAAITCYLAAYQLPSERTLLRLDGQYGTGAVLSELAGFAFVTRGKEYSVLDHPLVKALKRKHAINDV
jgi:hypothetical protein